MNRTTTVIVALIVAAGLSTMVYAVPEQRALAWGGGFGGGCGGFGGGCGGFGGGCGGFGGGCGGFGGGCGGFGGLWRLRRAVAASAAVAAVAASAAVEEDPSAMAVALAVEEDSSAMDSINISYKQPAKSTLVTATATTTNHGTKTTNKKTNRQYVSTLQLTLQDTASAASAPVSV